MPTSLDRNSDRGTHCKLSPCPHRLPAAALPVYRCGWLFPLGDYFTILCWDNWTKRKVWSTLTSLLSWGSNIIIACKKWEGKTRWYSLTHCVVLRLGIASELGVTVFCFFPSKCQHLKTRDCFQGLKHLKTRKGLSSSWSYIFLSLLLLVPGTHEMLQRENFESIASLANDLGLEGFFFFFFVSRVLMRGEGSNENFQYIFTHWLSVIIT